jgi:hypothetical protein
MRGRSPFGEAGNFVSAHQMSVEARLANRSLLDEAAATSDPSLRGVFDEDAVSVAGDVFALIGMGLNKVIGSSIPRAIAAVLIALVLVRISLRLVKRNHDFLLGQPIPAPDRDRVRAFLMDYPGVTAIRELLVTYIGTDQVWVLAAPRATLPCSSAQRGSGCARAISGSSTRRHADGPASPGCASTTCATSLPRCSPAPAPARKRS